VTTGGNWSPFKTTLRTSNEKKPDVDTPYTRLAKRHLTLPPVPAPAAAYQPFTWHDTLLFTAGQIPIVNGTLAATGKVGDTIDLARATELAAITALNLLAVADEATGGHLETIRLVKLTVFVAVAPTFTSPHLVANGASNMLTDILAEHGHHARSAVGVQTLPLDAPVETEAVFARL
jgi:enamine deaminase RidA (YjgF/YER057c/UK114 family)